MLRVPFRLGHRAAGAAPSLARAIHRARLFEWRRRVFLNAVRTLASHHWTSDGHEGTFIDQMLDSVTMDNDSPLAVLINPVGLRFHSTHHLFPSMPYHNIRAAHKRLMDQLPADSLYRLTVARSVWSVIGNVWRQAAEHNRRS